jgi:hypothetical protein
MANEFKNGIRRIPSKRDLSGLFPYIFKRRCDSLVFQNFDIDVENLLAYLKDTPYTFFQALILATAKLFRERPRMNRFIIGGKLYEREFTDISFVAKREFSQEAPETTIKLRVAPGDLSKNILEKTKREIGGAKENVETGDDKVILFLLGLPRFLLQFIINILFLLDKLMIFPKELEKIDPMHCGAFLANLGSVGIEAPYHHLFEWGTCSLFIAVGKIGKKVVANDDGSIGVKTMVEIKITLDERIADGYYYARSFDYFKSLIENPAELFSD